MKKLMSYWAEVAALCPIVATSYSLYMYLLRLSAKTIKKRGKANYENRAFLRQMVPKFNLFPLNIFQLRQVFYSLSGNHIVER